jgi:hypothetical protein
MALHTAELELRGDGRNYVGVAISLCARLRAAGHGGQILSSEATHSLVAGALPPGAALQDLGNHTFKDLAGRRRVFQLTHPDLPLDSPPLRSLDARAHNLPAQLDRFVGREREVAEGRRALRASRLLTLTGPGGSGKTRLALQLAADLVEEYPDGVWLVDLAAASDPALVPRLVSSSLRVREQPGRALVDTLIDYIAERRLLLLLDNCENAATVVAICRRLDGIPLAIELAAARTRALTIEDIQECLADRFRLLAAGGRTALPHPLAAR